MRTQQNFFICVKEKWIQYAMDLPMQKKQSGWHSICTSLQDSGTNAIWDKITSYDQLKKMREARYCNKHVQDWLRDKLEHGKYQPRIGRTPQ